MTDPQSSQRQAQQEPEVHSINDFYADLPQDIHDLLRESGYVALRNCIEGQKRMVLLVHFLINSVMPEIPGTDRVALDVAIRDTLAKYIQKEVANEEANKSLRSELREFVLNESSEQPPERELQQLEIIAEDKKEEVNRIYSLGESDFTDEIESIASHLLDDANSAAEGIKQKIEYPDGRVYEGQVKDGKKNGRGRLTLYGSVFFQIAEFRNPPTLLIHPASFSSSPSPSIYFLLKIPSRNVREAKAAPPFPSFPSFV